jgi:hypothetical protein
MVVELNQYVAMVIPWLKTIVWSALGLGMTIGIGYFLFVVKRRRKWIVNLWEQKADGRLHYVGKDVVTERKINKGKQVIYVMRRQKAEVVPPPWECVYRHRNKEYTDYIRVQEDDFRPGKRVMGEGYSTKEGKLKFIENIKDALYDIKHSSKEDIIQRYVYSPIDKDLLWPMNFEIISYDVNMMRINAIDNRDKIYADKKDFLEKYGTYIAIGVIVVLIIVVLYLSYDYSANVISQAMGEAQRTLGMVEQLAGKMGGTPPPS